MELYRWAGTESGKAVYLENGAEKHYQFINDFDDTMLTDEGNIRTYDVQTKNQDILQAGNILMFLYPRTPVNKKGSMPPKARTIFPGQPPAE